MRLSRNKKAQEVLAWEAFYIGLAGVALSIIVLTLVIFMANYKGSLTATPPVLESALLSSRFLSSPDCFIYQDPISERVDIRLIDLSRFTNENIAGCYQSQTTKDYQFQLKLRNLDTGEEKTIQTSEWYNVPSFTITTPIRIKQENNMHNGQLLIIVQKPI